MSPRGIPVTLACLLVLTAGGRGALRADDDVATAVELEKGLTEIRRLLDEENYPDAEGRGRVLLEEIETKFGRDSAEAARVINLLVTTLIGGKRSDEEETRALALRAAEVIDSTLGAESVESAWSLENLGVLEHQEQDYEQARRHFERALEIRKRHLPADHPDLARSLYWMAALEYSTGQPDQALAFVDACLAIREKILPPDHVDLLKTLRSKAKVYRKQARYDESLSLYERILEIRRKKNGENHPAVAYLHEQVGITLWRLGRFPEARSRLEKALAIQEAVDGSSSDDVARISYNLANVLSNMAEYDAAKKYYERTAAIYEEKYGPGHVKTVYGLIGLANIHRYQENPEEELPLRRRIIAIDEKALGPDHPDVGPDYVNLGGALANSGDPQGAMAAVGHAVDIFEKASGPDHPDVAFALNTLAGYQMSIGDFAAAREILERALAIREKSLGDSHPLTADTLARLADLEHEMQEHEAARGHYERALAIRIDSLSEGHPDVGELLVQIGQFHSATGNYVEARRHYERALAILERALGSDSDNVGWCLMNLANLLRDTGHAGEALPLYERALAIREKALPEVHEWLGWSMVHFADALHATGDSTRATDLLRRALRIYETTDGSESEQTAWTLLILARVLRDSGSLAEAAPLFAHALAIRETIFGRQNPKFAWGLAEYAELLGREGRLGEAFDRALEAEEAGREHLRLTSRAMTEQEALKYAAVRSGALDLILSIAARDGGKASPAWDALVRSRSLVLDEIISRRRSFKDLEDPEVSEIAVSLDRARSRLVNLLVRVSEDRPVGYLSIVDATYRDKERLERELAARSASFRRSLAEEEVDLDAVVRRLDDGPGDTALVSFAYYTDRLGGREDRSSAVLAFVHRQGAGSPVVVPLGPAPWVDSIVARWRRNCTRSIKENPEECLRAGEDLRRTAWDPLISAMGSSNRVLIVPDGALNLVNFAALPGRDGGYLVESGPTVHLLSAERDLASESYPEGEGLLVVGGAAFDALSMFAAGRASDLPVIASGGREEGEDAPLMALATNTSATEASLGVFRGPRSSCGDFRDLSFEPLPGAQREAEEIAALYLQSGERPATAGKATADRRVERLFADAASESFFKSGATGMRILHLATHGFFLGDSCDSALDAGRGIGGVTARADTPLPPTVGENPLLLAGLALAGANHRTMAGPDEDDGILTAEEIGALDLAGVEWAVLSACDTGTGEIRAGEGVLGLRRAFHVAGAETVIMSLWQVDDEATRQWMNSLYRGRFLEGLDTAEAVRRASLEVLQSRRKAGRSTHPFTWGAFVAAGVAD